MAQLVEQRIRNAWVGGSSPPFGSPPPFLRSSEVPILAAFLRPSFVLRLSAKHDGEAGDALRNAERCVASRLLPFAFAFCLSKLQRRGGEIKHLAQTMPHAPRFLLRRRCSALIVNHLVANGQKGQRADGLWLMRGGGQVARRGWASGQSGHLVIWSKSILDRQKTPL